MVTAEATETISCTPETFLEFVMDVERYAAVDDKLGRIEWVTRDSDFTEFQFLGYLPGVPLPPTRTVSQMRLSGLRIDIALAPPPANKLAHRISRFSASFVCAPVTEGTRVTRTVSFGFIAPFRWLIEPRLRGKLPASVTRELQLAKEILERR